MRAAFVLALALSAVSSFAQEVSLLPAASIQRDALGGPAYGVPFASKGNRMALTVAGAETAALTASVEDAPAWLRLGHPAVTGGHVSLGFDVERSAPVGSPVPVTLRLTASDGRSVVRTVRLVVEPPHEAMLDNPRPNPSHGRAEIGYALPSVQRVRLAVYDVLGREVLRLRSGEEEGAGFHRAEVSGLAAGVYLVRLVAGEAVHTTTLVRQ